MIRKGFVTSSKALVPSSKALAPSSINIVYIHSFFRILYFFQHKGFDF